MYVLDTVLFFLTALFGAQLQLSTIFFTVCKSGEDFEVHFPVLSIHINTFLYTGISIITLF